MSLPMYFFYSSLWRPHWNGHFPYDFQVQKFLTYQVLNPKIWGFIISFTSKSKELNSKLVTLGKRFPTCWWWFELLNLYLREWNQFGSLTVDHLNVHINYCYESLFLECKPFYCNFFNAFHKFKEKLIWNIFETLEIFQLPKWKCTWKSWELLFCPPTHFLFTIKCVWVDTMFWTSFDLFHGHALTLVASMRQRSWPLNIWKLIVTTKLKHS